MIRSCLACGQLRELAVWHGTTGVGICYPCRDARHVVSGGAVLSTPRTHDEFMAALDRIMQHYLGEDVPKYGDARFAVDYALTLEDRLSTLERDAARMREALHFYADPATWQTPLPGYSMGATLADGDMGDVARAALSPFGDTPRENENAGS